MDITNKQALFTQQYPALFQRLYRYVRYRVPNVTEAEDLVAEICFQAYRDLANYDDTRGTLEMWLIGIGRYQIIRYWQKRRITLDFDEALLLCGATEQTVNDQLDQRLFYEQVLDKLSPDAQALLALRYVDGLTYEEIAALTDKQPAAVRQFFSRLHQKLKLEFNPAASIN